MARSRAALARSTIGLEAVQPILENLVQVGQPVLDEPVKALELLLGVRHFPLQCDLPPVEAF